MLQPRVEIFGGSSRARLKEKRNERVVETLSFHRDNFLDAFGNFRRIGRVRFRREFRDDEMIFATAAVESLPGTMRCKITGKSSPETGNFILTFPIYCNVVHDCNPASIDIAFPQEGSRVPVTSMRNNLVEKYIRTFNSVHYFFCL